LSQAERADAAPASLAVDSKPAGEGSFRLQHR
jgi:hypothetical protein